MKKRIMALGLALSMAFAGTTAFAADVKLGSEGLTGNLVVDGTVTVPVVEITVPTDGAVVLNPYGLATDTTGVTGATDKIVSPEYTITAGSNNNIKADVYISAATVAKGTGSGVTPAATFAAYNTAIAKGTKSVLMGVQVAAADGTYENITSTDSDYSAADLTILGATYKPAADSIGIQLASEMEPDDTATFKFVGLSNSNASTPWTANDTVKVTVTYKVVLGDVVAP